MKELSLRFHTLSTFRTTTFRPGENYSMQSFSSGDFVCLAFLSFQLSIGFCFVVWDRILHTTKNNPNLSDITPSIRKVSSDVWNGHGNYRMSSTIASISNLLLLCFYVLPFLHFRSSETSQQWVHCTRRECNDLVKEENYFVKRF